MPKVHWTYYGAEVVEDICVCVCIYGHRHPRRGKAVLLIVVVVVIYLRDVCVCVCHPEPDLDPDGCPLVPLGPVQKSEKSMSWGRAWAQEGRQTDRHLQQSARLPHDELLQPARETRHRRPVLLIKHKSGPPSNVKRTDAAN